MWKHENPKPKIREGYDAPLCDFEITFKTPSWPATRPEAMYGKRWITTCVRFSDEVGLSPLDSTNPQVRAIVVVLITPQQISREAQTVK